MKIGKFGKITFVVGSSKVYTFNELKQTTSYNTDTKEQKNKKKQQVTNKGPGLESFSFTIQLNRKYVSIRKEVDKWKKLESSGSSYYFYLCGKKVCSNKLQITSFDCDYEKILAKFGPQSATLSVTLQEKPSKSKSKSAKNTRNKKSKTKKKKK